MKDFLLILAPLFCPCWCCYHAGTYSIFFIVFISLSFSQGPELLQTLAQS